MLNSGIQSFYDPTTRWIDPIETLGGRGGIFGLVGGGVPSGGGMGFGGSFGVGAQNVITPFEQQAFDILKGLGGYQPPAWAMNALQGIAGGGQTPEEQYAFEQAKQFFGPLGQSPYTTEALKAWEELTRPQIEQAMAIQGTYAPSGAFAETLSKARTEATVPLLQQELQARLGLIPQIASMGASRQQRQLGAAEAGLSGGLGAAQLQASAAGSMIGLGNTLADRYNQSLMNAYSMAGMPREMAQQQIGEEWKALEPMYNAYGQLYFGPFTGMFGSGSTTRTGGGGWGIGK